MKKYIKLGIGIVIAAFFVWLILKNIDLKELAASFRQAKLAYIGAAVVVFFIGYACRIQRWRLMLTQENTNLAWSQCAGPFFASVAANNVLPFRAGDILRGFGFNKQLGVSASTTVTTLFVERLLDLLMVVSFLGIALAYFGMDSSKLVGFGGSALLMAGVGLLVLLVFPAIFKPFAFALSLSIRKLFPAFGAKLHAEFIKVFTALEHTSKGATISKLIAWSFVAWAAEGVVFWLVALSIPTVTQALAAWIALPVGTLATVIPSTPGFVGTFDYFTKMAMESLGNSPSSSLAFAFMVHAVLWLPPTIVGGLYLLVNPVKQPTNERKISDE